MSEKVSLISTEVALVGEKVVSHQVTIFYSSLKPGATVYLLPHSELVMMVKIGKQLRLRVQKPFTGTYYVVRSCLCFCFSIENNQDQSLEE